MISTKATTQTWSKAQQTSGLPTERVNHEAVLQNKSQEADKSVGDQLNAVANPGGQLAKPRKPSGELGKDDFLKLMLTQMKAQDPFNPMQSHEMAAQLAQFTSLEQLHNVNKNLEGLTKSQDPLQKFQVLNFLGKSVKADSRDVIRMPGDQGSDLRFKLLGDVSKVKIEIFDEEGTSIKKLETGGLKKGDNKVVWNGMSEDKREVKPGKYMFRIEAESGTGNKIGVVTETKGTISGVNYTPEGPVLLVGNQTIRLQDVQKIEDDGLKSESSQTAPAAVLPETSEPKDKTVKPEAKDKKAEGVITPLKLANNGGSGIKVGGKLGN